MTNDNDPTLIVINEHRRAVVDTPEYDLVPIEAWAAYRADHPGLVYTGAIDQQGLAVFEWDTNNYQQSPTIPISQDVETGVH